MVRFTTILCPIDFSEPAANALAYAAGIAQAFDAELVVQHVLPNAAAAFPWAAAAGPGTLPLLPPESAYAALSHAVCRDAAGLEPRLMVQEGLVHERIVKLAEEEGADLLVLGTHGYRGFNRLFLGSVAEKVIRTATCPVLTVAPSCVPPRSKPVEFTRILCPIDYSLSAMRALSYAVELARRSGGRVTVLNVCEYKDPAEPPRYVDAGVRASRRYMIDGARQRLRDAVATARAGGGDIDEIVALADNRAGHEILRRAATTGADLIVMGAQGTGGLELMVYGSNTHLVVRTAGCPVLTVRA